jgi:possible sodium/hydrogen antiporter
MIFEMLFIISLVVIICMLTMLANKIKIAYPILLVLAGLSCSFWPAWR